MSERPRYTIIAPIYNEEGNIQLLYDRIRQVMDSTGEPWELITINDGSRDGVLAVVNVELSHAVFVPAIARTMQSALDNWAMVEPHLKSVAAMLEAEQLPDAFPFDQKQAHSPLPRAYQWSEGSVYLAHLERCRRATNRDLPQSLYTEIGMYQGGSDGFFPPQAPIPVRDDSWDIDSRGRHLRNYR